MCLIIFGLKVHPEYDLILVANRDEYFARRTAFADHWKGRDILAGKDLEGGGTWIGIGKNGKLAAVTNYRDPQNTRINAPTRGLIPVNFLESTAGTENFIASLYTNSSSYNGFNLLLKDQQKMYHYSNVSNKITEIDKGIHGLSNAFLNSNWPKVIKGKANLEKALQKDDLDDITLANLLRDESLAEENELPKTGIPMDLERKLSAMFIKIPGYGTRCTTVIKIKRDQSASFTEIVFDDIGNVVNIGRFQL